MLKILPLASSFHAAEAVHSTVSGLSGILAGRGIAHRMLEHLEEGPSALLVVTGGTEHAALEALARMEGPALILVHPHQNSLPAALEILCLLRQQGRTGRIFLLNGAEEGYASVGRLADHLRVREALGAARLGRIGTPSDWLVGSRPTAEAVRRAWGAELVDIPLEALRDAIGEADDEESESVRRDFVRGAGAVLEPGPGDLALAARVCTALRRLVREHRLDACTVRCFDLVTELRTTGCLALSALADEGTVAGCEGDVPAALTLLWMQLLTGQPGFMANPQDLDQARGTLWLAHCTIPRRLLAGYSLRSHFESGVGAALQGTLEPGPVTLARIGGAGLRGLFAADGELIANGDSPLRCRTQVQVRLDGGLETLLSDPMGNHHVLLRGHWARPLREFHSLFVAQP